MRTWGHPWCDRSTHLVRDKADYPAGPKCAHNVGSWLFELDGDLYTFSPPTQLQKDVWLGAGRSRGGEAGVERRVAALRWFCHECGTVQAP